MEKKTIKLNVEIYEKSKNLAKLEFAGSTKDLMLIILNIIDRCKNELLIEQLGVLIKGIAHYSGDKEKLIPLAIKMLEDEKEGK